MFNKLKPKSEFAKNVLTLMTGTTIAQAIPIAISPILTRLYSPKDFGIYALFIAIVSILASVINGRYELAIMLPKKDEDAINIFALGFIINSTLSGILLIIISLFNGYFVKLLNNSEIGIWLYFIPFVVFFLGLFNLLSYYNNRLKNYKDLAKANVIKSIVMAVVQLGIGFIKQGAAGLISGQLLSQLFANTKLLKNIFIDKYLVSKISKLKIFSLAKRYKKFPLFSIWAVLANTLSKHLTNILISTFFNVATLGFYSLVQRVLDMPSTLIGNSIAQVFFEEATQEKKDNGRVSKTFNATLKKLLIISVPIFILIFLTIEDLFAIVFGEEWRVAGKYAKAVIPLFFIRFIVSPFTLIAIIFEKINIDLFFQIGLLSLYILLFYINRSSFLDILYTFDYVIGAYYILYFILMIKISKGK